MARVSNASASQRVRPNTLGPSPRPKNAALLGGLFAVPAVARFAASFFPDERVWGLNHAAYLPSWATWGLLGISLLLCTPFILPMAAAVGRLLFGGKIRTADDGATGLFPRAILAALAAGVLFWVFRMHTYFLGDGAVYLAEIYRYIHGLQGSDSVLYSKGSAPGTGWIVAQLARIAFDGASGAESLLANPQFAFWTTAAVAGVGFVVVAFTAARDFFETADERAAAFVVILSAPGVLFFFGYVEYYTLHYASIGLYFMLLARAARGGSIAAAAAALVLAACFHFMAAVALPSLLLVILARSGKGAFERLVTLKALLVFAGLALAAGAVAYFALGIHTHGSRVVLSLYPFGKEGAVQSYTLLSSWHLIDAVNYAWLLAAPLCFAVAFLTGRENFRAPDVLAALANVIFMSFLAFFGNMGFGMARDWDINAGLGLACVFLLLALARHTPADRRRAVLVYAAAGSFAAVLPWLWVNISVPSSVARAKAVLALDDTHVAGDYALNGYEHMLKYFHSTGDVANAIWAVKKKIEMVGYPEDYKELALRTIKDAAVGDKRGNYDWLFDRTAEKIAAMQAAGVDSTYAGRLDEYVELAGESILQCRSLPPQWGFDDAYVEGQYNRFAAMLPASPVLALVRAQLEAARTGVIADADAFLRGARALRSSPTLAAYAGIGLASLNLHAPARDALLLAVRLDTAFTLPYLYLAESEQRLGPAYHNDAISHVQRFLATPDGWRVFGSSAQRDALTRQGQSLLQQLSTP